jgi:hypothetical protein
VSNDLLANFMLYCLSQKVFANESTLMEMDEIITQIQQWRSTLTPGSAEDDESPTEGYRSAAYDRLFEGEQGERPECEEGGTPITAHIDDIDMVAKVRRIFHVQPCLLLQCIHIVFIPYITEICADYAWDAAYLIYALFYCCVLRLLSS